MLLLCVFTAWLISASRFKVHRVLIEKPHLFKSSTISALEGQAYDGMPAKLIFPPYSFSIS